MAHGLQVEPLDATFGAVIKGVKLAELDDATWRDLHATWLQYALLVFPDQHLGRDDQIAFARRFGALEFEMSAISNVKPDGTVRIEADNDDVVKVLKGNMGWHCDSTYMPVQAKGAVFTAEVVPRAGGRTGWADMRAAYDALPQVMKQKLHGLVVEHWIATSRRHLVLALQVAAATSRSVTSMKSPTRWAASLRATGARRATRLSRTRRTRPTAVRTASSGQRHRFRLTPRRQLWKACYTPLTP